MFFRLWNACATQNIAYNSLPHHRKRWSMFSVSDRFAEFNVKFHVGSFFTFLSMM
jgi:hypothetical protein